MKPVTKKRLLVPGILLACVLACSSAAPRITSILRQSDCTTLTWTSQSNEFYNVYWADVLGPNPFWRVAAMHVPSGGLG